jgi:acyl carrier protein
MHRRIRKVLASVLGMPIDRIHDDSSVETVEEWDSLKQINLIMALEEEFSVRFEDDDVMELTSLDRIVKKLEALTG